MLRNYRALPILTFIAAGIVWSAHAETVQLLANGNFETGNLSGWTNLATPFADTVGSCNDAFAASTGGSGCIAGNGPADGTYDADASTSFPAISGTDGEWDNTLAQNFVVPAGTITSASVQFDATATCTGSGNFRGCGQLVQLFDGATFIDNFYTLVNPASNTTIPWTTFNWNITNDLSGRQGQTLTFELAEFTFFDTRTSDTSSSTALNAAFDDVSLNVTTPASTPEPRTNILIGLGLVTVACYRKRSSA